MAQEKELPGWPNKTLVKKVKQVLWRYVRCRPQITDPIWRKAWEWASMVEQRNSLFKFGKAASRKHWPADNEIATQYLLLAITDMKSCSQLRLPMHAAEQMPESVKAIFDCPALKMIAEAEANSGIPGPKLLEVAAQ